MLDAALLPARHGRMNLGHLGILFWLSCLVGFSIVFFVFFVFLSVFFVFYDFFMFLLVGFGFLDCCADETMTLSLP